MISLMKIDWKVCQRVAIWYCSWVQSTATDLSGTNSMLCARLSCVNKLVMFPPLLTTILLQSRHFSLSGLLSKCYQHLLFEGMFSFCDPRVSDACKVGGEVFIVNSDTYQRRADFRLAPSQWETLQCNAVSHWLCANLEWALQRLSQVVSRLLVTPPEFCNNIPILTDCQWNRGG